MIVVITPAGPFFESILAALADRPRSIRRLESTPELATIAGARCNAVITVEPRLGLRTTRAELQRLELELPLIVIADPASDEELIGLIKEGADDVVRPARLAQLGPAIEREIARAAQRTLERREHVELLVEERRRSFGVLSRSLVHGIRNPLGSVIGCVTEFGEWVKVSSVSTAGVDPELVLADMQRALEHIRDDISALAAFTGAWAVGAVDVNRFIDSVIRLTRSEVEPVEVERGFGALPLVELNQALFAQALFTLMVEAIATVPAPRQHRFRVATRLEPGHIVIEISRRAREAGAAPPVDPPAGRSSPRITVAESIAGLLGGGLAVSSDRSAFQLTIAGGPVERAIEPVVAPPRPPTGPRPQVLVVDDDARIGTSIRRALLVDHEVTATTDPRAALDQLVSGAAQFDVILCDLSMPELTGMELYAELERRAPHVARRVVFLTGGAFTDSMQAFIDGVPNPRIEKPFKIKDVRSAISSLIQIQS